MANICHKHFFHCRIGDLAIEMFRSFEISEKKPTDFNKIISCFHQKLFVVNESSMSRSNKIYYRSQGKTINLIFDQYFMIG